MWTTETLRAAIEARGENLPAGERLAVALLEHERYRGRTEEDYPKQRALRNLNRLLDQMPVPFPASRPGEYPGLKQLRAYAEERRKALEAEQANEAKDKAQAEQVTDPMLVTPEAHRAVEARYLDERDDDGRSR